MLTAYVPSINGGYDCSLEKARFTGRGEQLILSVGQGGDDGSIEYRIIDFADPKAVKEIFTGSDNAGVAATAEFVPDFRSKIAFATRWSFMLWRSFWQNLLRMACHGCYISRRSI